MLRDEIKQKDPSEAMTYSTARIKRIESYLIKRATRVFLKNGGKVSHVDDDKATRSYAFNKSGVEQADRSRENNRKKCVKASMKSKDNPTAFDYVFRSDANKDKFVFIVGSYISKQYDNINQAVNGLDFHKRKLENGSH